MTLREGMIMKTEYLREFVALAALGNFHLAAKHLFISQPTLSNHVRALEQELGFPLFDRERGNELTAPGSLFLDAAQAALASLDEAIGDCRKLSQAIQGEVQPVRIAAFVPHDDVRSALGDAYEGAYVFCEYHMGRPHFYEFAHDRADIACTYRLDRFPALKAEAVRLNLHHAPLGAMPCSFAMRTSHPLALGPLTRQGLKGARFAVLSSVEFGYWKSLVSEFLGPDVRVEFQPFPVDTPDNLRVFDLDDMILVSPKAMVQEFFACRDEYVSHDTVDGQALYMPCSVAWRSRPDRPLVGEMVAKLRQAFEEGRSR